MTSTADDFFQKSEEPSVIDVLILAGGRNRRMEGLYKGALLAGNETFADRLAGSLSALGGIVRLSTAETDRPLPPGVLPVRDLHPGCGPAAGLEAGLLASEAELTACAACDMPLLEPSLYRYLEIKLLEENKAAAIPVCGGRLHPTAGLYRTSLAGALTRALDRGERRLIKILEETGFLEVSLDGLTDLEAMMTNINTMEDYRRFQHLK